MDTMSMFGFVDIIVTGCGIYGFYSWYMLLFKHEIKKTFLVGGNTNPENCNDVEGFAGYMGNKLLILSIAMLVFGGISVYNSYVQSIGVIWWVGMVLFLAVIVWYCVYLRKADKLYFNTGAKAGKSIKEKALKK